MVTADGKSDSIEMPFMVTRNKQILARAKDEAMRISDSEQKEQAPLAMGPKVVPISKTALEAQGAKSIATGNKYILITATKVNFRESPATTAKIIGSGKIHEQYPYVATSIVAGKKWHEVKISETSSAWIIGTAATLMER
jgi:hypothetical protein